MKRVQYVLSTFLIICLVGLLTSINQIDYNHESKNLLESEKNTIKVVKDTVHSVVFVSNIMQMSRGFFNFEVEEVPAGAGSGFLWDDKGHVVTNYHVVKDGQRFQISFNQDKNQYDAKIVGVARHKDIAVLKLTKMPKKLSPIKIGNSKKLLVGQKTIAIGNPFGLDHTVTQGIISALGRSIKGVSGIKMSDMIQTDASINPGNSGGPLINSKGELIGMNTVIFSTSGASAGVGFSVPVDTISRIVPELIKYGKVIRPILGISLQYSEQIKNRFGLRKGVVIWGVMKDGPAAKAGLEGMSRDRRGFYLGDIILKIDKLEINNYEDLYLALDNKKMGDKVEITYIRNNKILRTKVTLIELK